MDAPAFVPHAPGAPTRAGHDQFGILGPIIADPHVTDVFVNGGSGCGSTGVVGCSGIPSS